jgi:hypothetical protein
MDLEVEPNVLEKQISIFRKALKKEAVCSSKNYLPTCKSTWYYNLEDQH